MRPPLRTPAAVFVIALALSGCGTSNNGPAPPDTAAAPAPRSGGPMTVAPVDGRVGDATAATRSGGVRRLDVDRRRTRPGVVREGVGAGASCTGVDLIPSAGNLPVIAASTLCLVNGARADAGLPPLTPNALLDRSALAHSQDMVARQYFAHRSLDGRDVTERIRATGYIPDQGHWTVGENLAWGTGTLATPKGIVNAWMNSQGHRENILRSSFREAGQGIVLGNPASSDGAGATYTMHFGAVDAVTAVAVAPGAPAPSAAARSSADQRRAALARRRKACRAKAKRARPAVRKRLIARCVRTSRRR